MYTFSSFVVVTKNLVQKFWPLLLMVTLTSIFYFSFMTHSVFVDEQENITAGWLMSKGLIPYRDFFFHHAPMMFYAAFISQPWIIGEWSIRLFVYIFFICMWLITFSKVHPQWRAIVSLGYVLGAISAPFLQTHLLLAESLISFSLIGLTILFASAWLTQTPSKNFLFIALTVVTFISVYSSVAFMFLMALFWVIFFSLPNNSLIDWFRHRVRWLVTAIISLGFIPFFYLVIGAFSDFWWAVITYNQRYYFVLRLAENDAERQHGILFRSLRQSYLFFSSEISAILAAVIQLVKTLKGLLLAVPTSGFSLELWKVMLNGITEVLFQPEALIVLLTVACLAVAVIAIRKPVVVLLVIGLILFSRIRSNEIFHQAPFYIMVLTLSVVTAGVIKRKIIWLASIGLLIILFSFIQIVPYMRVRNNPEKIISSKQIAETAFLAPLITEKQSVYIFTENPVDYYLLKVTPSFKYLYYYPWFHKTPSINEDMRTYLTTGNAEYILITLEDYSLGQQIYAEDMIRLLQNDYKVVNAEAVLFQKKNEYNE